MDADFPHVPSSSKPAGSARSGLLCWIVLAFALAGCRSTPEPSFPEVYAYPELVLTLAAGDELQITFMGAPNLNTTQTIRRDGKITLPLIGEVHAAGKVPRALQKELTEAYRPHLQLEETAVIVRSPAPVFVTGAVRNPGRRSTNRPITALEAIMESGGFILTQAEVRSVVVIRHENGRRFGYVLDFKDDLNGKEGTPFYLKPFDIVYVPRTFITKVNQWVEQHINRMLPRLGVGYNTAGEISVRR